MHTISETKIRNKIKESIAKKYGLLLEGPGDVNTAPHSGTGISADNVTRAVAMVQLNLDRSNGLKGDDFKAAIMEMKGWNEEEAANFPAWEDVAKTDSSGSYTWQQCWEAEKRAIAWGSTSQILWAIWVYKNIESIPGTNNWEELTNLEGVPSSYTSPDWNFNKNAHKIGLPAPSDELIAILESEGIADRMEQLNYPARAFSETLASGNPGPGWTATTIPGVQATVNSWTRYGHWWDRAYLMQAVARNWTLVLNRWGMAQMHAENLRQGQPYTPFLSSDDEVDGTASGYGVGTVSTGSPSGDFERLLFRTNVRIPGNPAPFAASAGVPIYVSLVDPRNETATRAYRSADVAGTPAVSGCYSRAYMTRAVALQLGASIALLFDLATRENDIIGSFSEMISDTVAEVTPDSIWRDESGLTADGVKALASTISLLAMCDTLAGSGPNRTAMNALIPARQAFANLAGGTRLRPFLARWLARTDDHPDGVDVQQWIGTLLGSDGLGSREDTGHLISAGGRTRERFLNNFRTFDGGAIQSPWGEISSLSGGGHQNVANMVHAMRSFQRGCATGAVSSENIPDNLVCNRYDAYVVLGVARSELQFTKLPEAINSGIGIWEDIKAAWAAAGG